MRHIRILFWFRQALGILVPAPRQRSGTMELWDVVASSCSEFTRLPSCVCYSVLPPQRQWLGIQTTSRGIFRVHPFYAAVVAITECLRPYQQPPTNLQNAEDGVDPSKVECRCQCPWMLDA
jgi:hypothetical protein